MIDNQIEIEVKLKSSPVKPRNGERKLGVVEREEEREKYNAELDWIKSRPPSEEQLVGKLFMGWYQTEDITNYELSDTYKHNKQIDMKEIVDDIPRFIASCRDSLKNKRISELPDLGRLLEGLYQAADLRSFAQDLPAFVEDCRTSVQNSGQPCITNSPRNNKNNNTTADSNAHDNRPLTHTCANCDTLSSDPQTLYVMLDYLLEISVPEHLLHHFTTFKNKVQNTTPRSRPQSARSRATRSSAHRWVFIPCHCDVNVCYGNMFHCLDSVIPVLVVPYEKYKQYTAVCENSYVVVRLPSCVDKTTGFTNYWIQLIAKKLSLEQIWIVEDQVKSFYRAVPNRRLPLTKSGSVWSYNIPEITRRLVSFTEVMKHLEERMEQDAMYNPTNPMSIIGLSNEIRAQTEPYSYNIPIGAILLNLRNLGDLKFHPELHQIDTQVLACEAVKSGQRVFVCNSFVLLDTSWNVTQS